MHLSSPSASRRRGLVSVLAAFAVGVSGFFAAAAPAQAEVNSRIVLSNPSFTHVNADGKPVNGSQVYRSDYLEFAVDYDATSANPKPGDQFTITLPPALDLRDVGVKKQLKTADDVVAGECALANSRTESTITCTFNEAISGKIDIKGSISANLYVDGTTDSSKVEVGLNGKAETVSLPYDKPIVLRPYNWKPGTNPGKYSEGVSGTTKSFNWYIYAPGKWLNTNYAAGSEVVITDNLTKGVLFPVADKAQYHLIETCADSSGQGKYTRKANASGTSSDGFSIKVDIADTHNVTITAKGPWNDACDYQFTVRSEFASGQAIKLNYTYENAATFTAVNKTVKGSRTYTETFEGTIQYRDGFGGFKVVKRNQGDDAAALADQKFTFAYKCTDGQTGKLELSEADGVKQVPAEFADGVKCTVTESGMARDGYTWSGTETQDVTIKAGETAQVEFVNTYKEFEVVKPTDPTFEVGVCQDGAPQPTEPTVTAPADTEQIKYSGASWALDGDKVVFTVTAEAKDGYKFDKNTLPEGWTLKDDADPRVAQFEASVAAPECIRAAAVASPEVLPGTCEDGATTPTDPTVKLAETEGVAYGTPTFQADGDKVRVSVVAKAKEGFMLDGGNLPEGWVYNQDGTATFTTTVQQPKCEQPPATPTKVTPVNPTVLAGICKPGSQSPTAPTVSVPLVPGLSFGAPKVTEADGKVSVTVTVTANSGYTLGDLPEGWTLNSDGSATYTYQGKTPSCVRPSLPKTGD